MVVSEDDGARQEPVLRRELRPYIEHALGLYEARASLEADVKVPVRGGVSGPVVRYCEGMYSHVVHAAFEPFAARAEVVRDFCGSEGTFVADASGLPVRDWVLLHFAIRAPFTV